MMARSFLLLCSLSVAGAAAASSRGDDVVSTARRSVETALAAYGTSVALAVTGRPSASVPGDVSLRALPVVGRFPRERFTVDVQQVRHGRVIGVSTVSFALHVRAEGWVYARDAQSHEEAASIAMERRPVDVARAATITPEATAGMRLKRSVRAGQPIVMADFERVPDVDNRQPVRLRAAFGEITVESAGTALRAGNRGDVVTVQVAGATRPVKATVVDRGVAELVQ